MKIAFLSNFTNDFIVKELSSKLKENGEELALYLPGFNQINQEIINPQSELYKFSPEIIFISMDYSYLFENLLNKIIDINVIKIKEEIFLEFKNFLDIIETLLENSRELKVFIDSVVIDSKYFNHLLELNSEFSVSDLVVRLNAILIDFAEKKDRITLVNLHNVIYKYGEKKLFDNRLLYLSKNKWSSFGIRKVAELYTRYINAYFGKRKKCIVLDLDNTLWGGIVGQDGVENILLSNDGVGKAFYDFQLGLLKLYNQGILLAINSKNNENDVLEALEKHPYMVLRKNHFSSIRINWNNKAQNIKEISKELNIGIDSLVFLDDSEFERNLIKSELPEVAVPDLPDEPSDYASFLSSLPFFDTFFLSKDDFKRNKTYLENIKRKELENSFTDIKEYYRSLNMRAYISSINDFSFSRVVQLIQKTNQFNMTTKRYTESEVRSFLTDDKIKIFTIRLEDKFGDYGIIATIIVFLERESIRIDSFIMSCRVIGRTLEKAILSYVYNLGKKLNKRSIVGEFYPTKKNIPAAKVYPESGFKQVNENTWFFDIQNNSIKCPEWIKFEEEI